MARAAPIPPGEQPVIKTVSLSDEDMVKFPQVGLIVSSMLLIQGAVIEVVIAVKGPVRDGR